MHKHVPWDDEQCFPRKFLISLHRKYIFHFSSAKSGFFYVKELEEAQFGLMQTLSIETVEHFYMKVHIPIDGASFLGISFFFYASLSIYEEAGQI
jgi:hypothetical protein